MTARLGSGGESAAAHLVLSPVDLGSPEVLKALRIGLIRGPDDTMNQALTDLAHDRINGAAVLRVAD